MVPFLFTLVSVCGAPQISEVEPLAIRPGATTVLTFTGKDLESVSNLWTSFGGEAERIKNTNRGAISFSVRCPDDPSGIHAVQLAGSSGASAFRLVLVDYLPALQSHRANRKPESAMTIPVPSAVDGQVKSEASDYFKFKAKAGENLSVEVIAHRIGSQMDPTVRVFDKSGKEIAFCDDEGGTWRDARFLLKVPVDGDYTIAVNDVGYAGGANYYYRLRVSHDPLIWYTFPLFDPSKATVAFETMGENRIIARRGSPANPPLLPKLGPGVHLFETEPNDNREDAQAAVWPSVINGKLTNSDDRDVFRIKVERDHRVIFRTQARSLGSPCDLVLCLRKVDGTIIARSDSATASDAALTNKFFEAGEYFLEVTELSGYGVANAAYRLVVEKFAPGFTASVEENIVAIKPGEKSKLKVSATRQEYDGAIRLKLEPSIPGISLEPNEIPEKKKDIEVTFSSKNIPVGFFKHARIIATGTNDIPAAVSTVPALKKTFPLMLHPPPTLDGIVTVVVRDE
jgi:hypothetical protein